MSPSGILDMDLVATLVSTGPGQPTSQHTCLGMEPSLSHTSKTGGLSEKRPPPAWVLSTRSSTGVAAERCSSKCNLAGRRVTLVAVFRRINSHQAASTSLSLLHIRIEICDLSASSPGCHAASCCHAFLSTRSLNPLEPDAKINSLFLKFLWVIVFYHGNRNVTNTEMESLIVSFFLFFSERTNYLKQSRDQLKSYDYNLNDNLGLGGARRA